MENNEIIKALECCSSQTTENTCGNCPLFNIGRPDCYRTLAKHSLDLINRQKAEIERLTKENEKVSAYIGNSWGFVSFLEFVKNQRAEAIKEFAERLKNECDFECDVSLGYGRPCYEDAIPIIAIDNLVKEMVGEE
jgi:hypothetical protein